MKKIIKYLVSIIIISIILGGSYLHFAPVEFDASICSGGYKKWIVDNYTQDLINKFITIQGYDKDINYNLVSKPEEIIESINWSGRNIKSNIKIEVDNKNYNVNFIGKRYWIEKYNWEVDTVE